MNRKNLRSEFIKYVSLNIIGMLGLSCYILADTFFIAQGIGANGLTALNIAIPVYSFIHGVGLMIGIGGATRYTISRSKSAFSQSIYYGVFMASICLLLALFFTSYITQFLGADATVFSDSNIYIKTILFFSPMFLLNNIILCFVRNDGNPQLSMIAMLSGSFSNIILDYILIFICKIGMFGAALATGIAPIVSLAILSSYFIKKKNTFHFTKGAIHLQKLWDISSLGISALITEFSSGIVIIVFNIIILDIAGNTGVAAYGIIANIALVILAVFTAISQGSQPIISRCWSRGETHNARKILKYAMITAIAIAVIIYVFSIIFTTPIISAFNRDGDAKLANIATTGLYIYFTSFIFSGVNIVIATYFSAIGSPQSAFISALLRGFILIIPMTFILSFLFDLNGVWLAVPLTEFLVLLLSIYLLYSRTDSTR